MTSAYRPDIDGLRALAVIPVVLFHAGIPGFSGGFVGVDVFFVISGFLITGLIAAEMDGQHFSLLGFYERRVRRIIPALLAVIAASCVAGWFLFMPAEFVLLGNSAVAAALSASNILFWLESGYFATSSDFKPLLHTWSLAVEEQFYIVFPLLLIGLKRFVPARVPLVLGLLAAFSFAASVWGVAYFPDAAFYNAWSRAWELLLGALIALRVFPAVQSRGLREMLLLAGLALALGPVFLYSKETDFPGLNALAPCAGAALILHCGGSRENLLHRFLAWRPLVAVGLVSYSLYLWHWPMIVFARQVAGGELTSAQTIALLLAALAVSWLSWKFIEQPFRRRGVLSRRAVFGFGGMGVALASVAGLAIVFAEGVSTRLPADVQAVLAVGQDGDEYFSPRCFTSENEGPSPEDIQSGRLCGLGKKDAAPSFVLWGDSHAGAMAAGVDQSAKQAGLGGLMIVHGSCPPILGYQRSERARHAACKLDTAAALELIRSRRIPLVIMTSKWARYVNGTVYGNEGPFFDPALPIEVIDQSAVVAPLLDATLAGINAAGARAVLVADVPEIGYDLPYAVARAMLQRRQADFSPAFAAVAERQQLSLKLLTAAAAKFGSIFLQPTDLLCSGERCRVEHDGTLLYRDEDHLSIAGALYVSSMFDAVFASLAAKPGSGP